MTSDSEKNICVEQQQQQLYELFGYRDVITWDCYYRDEKDAVRNKIKLLLGTKSEDGKFDREDIVESIWRQTKYTDGVLYMSQVLIATVDLYEDWNNCLWKAKYKQKYQLHPLFRIMKCVKKNNTDGCCMIFVDENARVYETWENFKAENTFPKCIIVAPRKGIYLGDSDENVILETFASPACTKSAIVVQTLDASASVTGIGASLLTVGGLIALPFAPVIAPAALGVAAVSGITVGTYSMIRSGMQLYDRSSHEQSISLANPESRGCWLGIAGGATGVVAGGASRGLSYLASSGRQVSMLVRGSVNVLNAACITVNGAGIVNGFVGIILKWDNQSISLLEVVQLSSSLLLFTHSVYNFQSANSIIQSSRDNVINDTRQNLSRNQRKAFDKMAKETIRLHGEEAGKTDIIRTLRTIPDQKEYFRDMFKINKQLNKNGVKVSFSGDENVNLNNGGGNMKPSVLRNNLKQMPASEVFANVPTTNMEPRNAPAAGQLNLQSQNASGINYAVVKAVMTTFAGFASLVVDDLQNTIVNAMELLTKAAFDIFMDIVQSYVTNYQYMVERWLNRFVPIETFMTDILKCLHSMALQKGSENFSQFIENIKNYDRRIIYQAINDFYEQFRMRTPNNPCKVCGGCFNI